MIVSWWRRDFWQRLTLALLAALCAVALSVATAVGPGQAGAGVMTMREGEGAAAATPVPAAVASPNGRNADASEADPLDGDPLDGDAPENDPLDGDPLDGPPRGEDPQDPRDLAQFEIVRSGRPNGAPRSLPAYDEDAETVWTPSADAVETWLWLDLGEERRLRAVRWLARGSGGVEVAVSADRRRWRQVDRVEAGRGWQEITLREDARYVRLELLADDEGNVPAIAEVAVYGAERRGRLSLEQEADEDGQRRRDRRAARDEANAGREARDEERAPRAGGGNESRAGGRVRISAERGETRCRGDRERCEAREGRVSVEEDCAEEGSCTIDVHADGGTAICEAAGGDDTEAGDGNGRRGGEGGRCEAVANGGAVAIGDINP